MEDTNKNTITITIKKGNSDNCPFVTETFKITPVGYDEELERYIIKSEYTDFTGFTDTKYHNSYRITREIRNTISDILDSMIKEWSNAHNV